MKTSETDTVADRPGTLIRNRLLAKISAASRNAYLLTGETRQGDAAADENRHADRDHDAHEGPGVPADRGARACPASTPGPRSGALARHVAGLVRRAFRRDSSQILGQDGPHDLIRARYRHAGIPAAACPRASPPAYGARRCRERWSRRRAPRAASRRPRRRRSRAATARRGGRVRFPSTRRR